MDSVEPRKRYALVLGASSGFGAATSIELAREGLNIFGVHLDRKSTIAQAEKVAEEIRALGREAHFFNVNAADEEKRAEIMKTITSILGEDRRGRIQVLFHSLAFGTLKPFMGEDATTRSQLEMTLDVMANSLVYWVQDLVQTRGFMNAGGRIIAMTSEGSTRVWARYGAISAAKAALESYCRQLAVELAPMGITVNAVRAGVTDTPAARRIPGFEDLQALALKRNPHRRLTTPEDVARFVVNLIKPETAWLTGNVLGVDGGEHLM